MSLEELQSWILSSDGMGDDFQLLSRLSAVKSVSAMDEVDPAVLAHNPDWQRLLLAASILATSPSPEANEAALAVAQAGILYSNNQRVAEASATVLTQLANHRAVQLAISRDYLDEGFGERLGVAEQILLARRELEYALVPTKGQPIAANRFQRSFWDELQRAAWISASAPTASGKTYLVLRWLLNEFSIGRATLAVFLAPTRALVGEIERELLELSADHQIAGLRVASLPLAALGDRSRPTILVFTQERLHGFLNSMQNLPNVDVMLVDEVQKIGDGLRGVILQDAVERVVRSSPNGRLIFLSPLTQNPELLVQDSPPGLSTAVVPSDLTTVTQNLLVAEQMPRHSDYWRILLRQNGSSSSLGIMRLHAKPDTPVKRLSYLALAFGRQQSGTLVYANGAAEAEKIAGHIVQGLGRFEGALDPELKDISDFVRDTVHPQFLLVSFLRRGVGFHYGNMPSLLRSEIERLFKEGKIRYLVCTSTLVEGVNLACRTIVVRGPRKGNNKPMEPHDFWNLAGRAGRWGQDFSGNIVCVDVRRPNLWPQGVPERARYPIKRETDSVLSRRQPMLDYLEARLGMPTASLVPSLEQVAAYLLAWRAREGSFLSAPSASRLPADYAQEIDFRLKTLLDEVDLPTEIISRHPGVSAVALQSLIKYFRHRRKPVEDLLPATPESEDAYVRLIAIFQRINKYMFLAFFPSAAIPAHALVTIDWMRGLPLSMIIGRRIDYFRRRGDPINLSSIIRATMRDVEEIARFRAPKYLSAYLDVLKHHLVSIGRLDLWSEDLRFELYLEFGVATQTLLSLIGIGVSRTTAVAINEFVADDKLSEDAVLEWLRSQDLDSINLSPVVRRELKIVLSRRENMVA